MSGHSTSMNGLDSEKQASWTAMIWCSQSRNGGKAIRTMGQGADKDETHKMTKITQEAERSKGCWSSL